MNSSGYRSDGVTLAVAVVNAVVDPEVDEAAALDEALRQYGAFSVPLSGRDRAGLRQWAHHLHAVFDSDDAPTAANLLNQLLDVVPTHAYIDSREGRGLYVNFAPPEASPLQRVQASTVMGLSLLICDYGMTRLGVCRAGGCECVYVDVSRNAQRRFCSESCANRTNVAAFRARARGHDAKAAAGS